jgi:dienelactone hydrolase
MNPVIHGRLDCGDHTVEKVYFESLPGFFVTGNLYRPKGQNGKRPAVLCPHGHFPGGRFIDEGPDAVRHKIVHGAERFEEGGRSFMQARCVQLARMGCVVFHFDMIGYADSQQIPEDIAHRFSRSRIPFKQAPASGLYSAVAELRLQSIMGLHTYNSIRALDFLSDLPDVDPERIAVTGGSGGGTQTFMLCAVDDRPRVSVPVVIVGTTQQGGCTCEHVCGLRLGTYNLEFTALHSPKPLLLISADDSTRTMPERGFPELKQLYQELGAEDELKHVALLHYPHNYNSVSRSQMYLWLNRHLDLGLEEPILEKPYQRLTEEQMSVWNDEHPAPRGGPEFEQGLLDWLTADSDRQMTEIFPRDPASLQSFREVVGTAWRNLLRQDLPEEVEFESRQERDRVEVGLLRYESIEAHQAELPLVIVKPVEDATGVIVWIDGRGKAALFDSNGKPNASVRKLTDSGKLVIGVDLLSQGEFLADDKPIDRNRWLPNEQAFASWTYCYNMPLYARRSHDVLATIAYAKQFHRSVDLMGTNGGGHFAAAALALARDSIGKAAIDTSGFRFGDLKDIYDVDFMPGAVKYQDLPGLLSLSAPTGLWLAGEDSESVGMVLSAYDAAAGPDKLTLFSGKKNDIRSSAVEWLMRR